MDTRLINILDRKTNLIAFIIVSVDILFASFVINTVVKEPIINPKGNSIILVEYENKLKLPSPIVEAHDLPNVGSNI